MQIALQIVFTNYCNNAIAKIQSFIYQKDWRQLHSTFELVNGWRHIVIYGWRLGWRHIVIPVSS